MKTTGIVILNYRNYRDTINCIDSILSSDNGNDYLIIVVDNDSQNESVDSIYSNFQNSIKTEIWNGSSVDANTALVVVRNTKNAGYAAGNNIGLVLGYEIGCKYLMVLNNDTLFRDRALTRLIEVVEESDEILCSGPLLLKGDGSIDYNCAKRKPTYLDLFRLSYFGKWLKTSKWRKEYYYILHDPKPTSPIEVDIISGSCMLFKAKEFKQIEFFDERTFLYFEEAIIHEKAQRAGLKLMFVPDATIIHLGAQTTKAHSVSMFTRRCEYQSLRYYLKKYRGLPDVAVNLLSLSSLLFIKLYPIKQKLKALNR